uniref:Adenylate kinase isoenzyme 6 homolog n=1 Tax=Strombidium inclinatum TaxID=197538 RepID=A0A7S3IMH2_9SPIT|mmetsp:Transcript_25667/g.39482  ORF Transcript_25667/g.39482 Transcript_25667/m.39482 type:complete len:193 (+) Transcript_25667:9-587(+)
MEDQPNPEVYKPEYATELPNILVTGTPGVGKTSLCTLLESQLPDDYDLNGFQYIKLTDLIKNEKLYKNWNEAFDVPEFDEDMVCDYLEPLMSGKGGIILEFHSCDFFPERWFQMIVLLRCNNTELYDRLKERGYKEEKITENIECEIFGELAEEVKSSYKPEITLELSSEKVDDMEENIVKIAERMRAILRK